jgi:CheY-like chemotaxis protein
LRDHEEMKQAIVVDSNTNHRSSLMHQLSQTEYSSNFQFKTLIEAQNKLLSLTLFSGMLFLTIENEASNLHEFLTYARSKHPNMPVVAVLDSVSLPQMRALIGAGVDQLLLRPFTLPQLLQKIQAAEGFRNQVLNDELKGSPKNTFHSTMELINEKYFKASFLGTLVENSELPSIPEKAREATLFLDCDHLRGINSVGIRSWMLWFKALESQGFKSFEFDKLRPPLLQQASLVQGFIPKVSVVNSFYLYYWCEEIDEEKEFLISFGKHYGTTQMKLPKLMTEKRGQREVHFELDPSVVKFLKFYSGQIEIV